MAQRNSTRTRSNRTSSNGRSASQKPAKYRFAHNVAGHGTVPEHEYLEYSKDGAGLDEADLILNVPVVKVDSIHLQLEDLEAHVALKAQVLDLLKLTVGIDLTLGKVRVDVAGVEAQALLKVRLDYVAAAIDRVLSALDRNPDLLESVGSALEDVGWGAGRAVGEAGEAVEDVGEGAEAALGDIGQGAGQAVGQLGQGAGQAVGDIGQGAGQAVGDLGQALAQMGDGAGQPGTLAKEVAKATVRDLGATASQGAITTAKALGEATKRKTQELKQRRRERRAEKHNATEAAMRMAKEHNIDLDQIEGTGADGRITVHDVRSVRDGDG
jgi:hypothetical protein